MRALSLSRYIAVAALTAAACGAEGGGRVVTTDLTVWNRSNYQLLEVRVHGGRSYDRATNTLGSPLFCEGKTVVRFTTGDYVTVIRRKNAGERIALTTAEGLDVNGPGYVLIVFDEMFRLVRPAVVLSDGGDPDGGDPAGGDAAPGDPGNGDFDRGDAICF